MKIDIGDLLKQKIALIDIDFIEDKQQYEPYFDRQNVHVGDKICFNGSLTNNEGVLVLDGKLSFTENLQCDRCLKQIAHKKTINVNVSLIDSGVQNQKYEYAYEGSKLDITDIIKDEILLNMPIKHVCSESCLGICPICGIDLNMNKCSCKQQNFDTRFEALKQLKLQLDNPSGENDKS